MKSNATLQFRQDLKGKVDIFIKLRMINGGRNTPILKEGIHDKESSCTSATSYVQATHIHVHDCVFYFKKRPF